MYSTRNNHLPVIPSIRFQPKSEGTTKCTPENVFSVINSSQNPNFKYMIPNNQFNSRHAPVLTFYASYDNRGENPRDQMKFRKCNILYFVEDATIKVYEPHQRNTGFLQGCLINRNKIPKFDGKYYNLDDLNIGKTLSFFSKTFKILDCDSFTKQYLQEMGYRVGSPEPEVIDPVYADRQEVDRHRTCIQKPHKKEYKSVPFYKLHPKRLHFYVIYNIKPHHFQEMSYASLYYDISDNTIKIVDEKKLLESKKQLKIGNYDSCLILKPTLIPKKSKYVPSIGESVEPVVLNLTAASRQMHLKELMGCRSYSDSSFLRDSNPVNNLNKLEDYYAAKDLDLGITIEIFGTKVYIYDCDEFTKEFYRTEFNRELIPAPLPEIKSTKYHQLIYKQNFGNAEDSLQTCQQLPTINISKIAMDSYILSQKPCHKGSRSDNLLKFFVNCRYGCDGKILKFLCRILTNDSLVKDQYLVLQWFLEDETIEISGLDMNFTISNSNVGQFLKRMKLIKPTSEVENAGTCYYSTTDMFIGNIIYAMKKPFLIIDADEYTCDYMERNCDRFVHSNIKQVLSELLPVIRDNVQELTTSLKNYDLQSNGFVTFSDFRKILLEFIPDSAKTQFLEHQIKTLARYFACEKYVGLNFEQLVSRIQTELKKLRFEDFEKLETLFQIHDLQKPNVLEGHFEPAFVYYILRSYPLTIDRDLLKSFVYKFPTCNGLISFKEIIKHLNYFENPVNPPDLTPYAIKINWEKTERIRNLNKICYTSFLKELTSEKCPNC